MWRRWFRSGFTLVELLVVIAIIGVLVALLLPAVQAAREAARRSSCSNNLKQHALSMHNYHDTYKVFPALGIRPENNQGNFGGTNNGNWYGWLIATMPYIEQKPLYDNIMTRVADPTVSLPTAWYNLNNNSDPWANQNWKFDLGVNMCPSSPKPTIRTESPALLSYKVCVGDDYHQNHFLPIDGRDNRGIFQMDRWIGMEAITDGTSQTVMMGECVMGGQPTDVLGGVAVNVQQWSPQDCWNRVDPNNRKQLLASAGVRADFRPTGGRALDGRPYYVGFATLVAPNGPTCHWGGVDGNEHEGTLSSFHPGGGQVAMADGHVQFISQTINAGNPTIPDDGAGWPSNNRSGPSPYGVWGALGSKNGTEAIANQ
ncbi:MAG TPA: DUF1559 domain-containing protein [Pirellulaceae bacterium]|nr:DUF1559 domain-containing protein [Pirellulaceae bacterium]